MIEDTFCPFKTTSNRKPCVVKLQKLLMGYFAFVGCSDFFSTYHQSVNSLNQDQAWCFVGSDLGPNYLQSESADNTRRQRVNKSCCNLQNHMHVNEF